MLSDLPERISAKIREEGDCWVWIGARDPLGYGRVTWQRRTVFSHRLVVQLLGGDPGKELDHLCRNSSCCNPAHLEPVTHIENVRRGHGPKAVKDFYAGHLYCPKGHPLFGANLYAYVTRLGYVNKQCRTCRRETKRARRAAGSRD